MQPVLLGFSALHPSCTGLHNPRYKMHCTSLCITLHTRTLNIEPHTTSQTSSHQSTQFHTAHTALHTVSESTPHSFCFIANCTAAKIQLNPVKNCLASSSMHLKSHPSLINCMAAHSFVQLLQILTNNLIYSSRVMNDNLLYTRSPPPRNGNTVFCRKPSQKTRIVFSKHGVGGVTIIVVF